MGRVSTEVGLRGVFTVEFKRDVVQQLLKGEQTLRRSRARWTFVILRYPRLWSSGIYCSSSGSRFNLRDTSSKGCADGPMR